MDSPLVLATRGGDEQAFTSLYVRYAPLVRAILRDFTRDPEELADLTQEVFARAYAALPSLRDPERFRPWLQSIARYVGRDARKAHARYVHAALPDDELPTPEAGPEDLVTFIDLAELVDDVIVELNPRDALAVSLANVGFGPAEVAEALGISYGAAKVTLHRARGRLRAAILLRLLLGDERLGCATFAELCANSRTGSLTRHVAACATCGARALALMG
jgi:RNA polymerase sigma factor (sigma-70 family)